MRMPGFTAESALYRTDSRSYAVGHAIRRAPGAGISPQQWVDPILADYHCYWNGWQLICGDAPFGGGVSFGGDKSAAQCRKHCYATKKGTALADCLADC